MAIDLNLIDKLLADYNVSPDIKHPQFPRF
jgi:hypothetical protein